MNFISSTTMDRRPPVDPFRSHIESLELAGGMLDRYLQMDSTFPSFLDVTRISAQEYRIPTVSGQADADYPISDDLRNLKQISTVNKVPLPPEVMEHFGHLQCHCMMGLFTEISRAWLTIDSDIYMWTYERGSDVAFFDGLGETIVNVGLVKPKPGVFNSFVKYLLILTTTIEIVVLGVTFSSSKESHLGAMEEMHLLPDPVFVIPTDSVTVNTTACTDSGRIFLGGKDGNLYEIMYQAESGWFGKRCKKVNHSKSALSFLIPSFISYPFRSEDSIVQISIDNSRNILYTLSENGVVEVYDLGEAGSSTSRVTSVSQNTMVQMASHFVQFLDTKIFLPIVKLCAVEADESPYINFVIVTKSGARLYFCTSSSSSLNPRPSCAQLLHIRLPPGYTASTISNRPMNVHKALYGKGSLILIASPQGEKGERVEKDVLWCLSSDPYPFRGLLVEMQTLASLNGTVWALEEVKNNPANTTLPCLKFPPSAFSAPAGQGPTQGPVSDPPLIVRQHMEPPRKYIVLTSQGVEILMKLRPVDMLRQLLLDNRGPDGKSIRTFFKEQREDQACATCLILACLDSMQNAQLAEWASRAFFLHGAEPPSVYDAPPQALTAAHSPAPSATAGVASSGMPLSHFSIPTGFNPTIVSTPLVQSQQPRNTTGVFSPGPQSPQSFASPVIGQQILGGSLYQQQLGKSQQQTPGNITPQKPAVPTLRLQQPHVESPAFQQSQLESSLLQHSQINSPVHQRVQLESPVFHQVQQQQFGSALSQHHQQQFTTPVSRQQIPQQPPLPSTDQSLLHPQQVNPSGPQPPAMFFTDIPTNYSAKHHGFYLYLGRILGPIWNLRTVQSTMIDSKGPFLLSYVTREDCVFILGHLHALRSFLEKNPQYSTGYHSLQLNASVPRKLADGSFDASAQSRTKPNTQDVQQEEKRSLDAFKVLLAHVCEVMGLWKILCEHQFHIVAASLSEGYQTELMGVTFRSLILAGHELCSLLINSLVNSYLNDNASVDAISAKLREVCPHLYRNEDAACSKANEMLLSARNIQNQAEKEAKLMSALQLCKNVAPQVNLPLICQWFASSQFYEGILDLCTTCALKLDPKNIAEHYYKNRQPPGDEEGYRAFFERMQCYKEITSVLDQLYGQSMSSPYTPSIPSSPGQKAPNESGQVPLGDSKQQAKKLVEGALMCQDELLHVAIYEWMLSKDLLGEMIFMAQPSYEDFIQRKAENSPNTTYMFDLLWKYYEKNENHAGAAKVLLKLATTQGKQVPLSQRVAYLARAVMCMRSDKVGCAPQLGVFLRELEDKIEVARLQQQILDSLSLKPQTAQINDAIGKLNSSLLDITELYEQYAEPFNLWDCKLAIIHCSGHQDQVLIEHVWQNILETELRATSARDPNSKMAVIMSKVKALGQEYSLSPRCFPLAFLVKQLELQCCQVGADCLQVHPTMLLLGASLIRLIQVYDSLIAENDLCWFKNGREFHLHEVVGHLLAAYIQNPKMVAPSEKHLVTTKAEDLLTKCLLFLIPKSNAKELIDMLQGVKAQLSRMGRDL